MREDRVEAVFSTDTTGSMSPCRDWIRRLIEDALTRLFKEIPNLKIGIGFNGDYCDARTSYVTRWHDLSTDIHGLCHFVRTTPGTNGGDLPECYELVLSEAQKLNWSHNAKKIFVLIADDVPHPVSDPQNIRYNSKGLDWRKEAGSLTEMGVQIYTVQCLSKGRHATAFYKELADYYFELDQFSEVVDLITAICYKQAGPEELGRWEKELKDRGRMTRSMDANFATLIGRPIATRFAEHPRALHAVLPGRFQILEVGRKVSIREFVEKNGLEFKPGRGFYEFTKTETIQERKEVVLRDKVTGDMFSGGKAREMIGLRAGERARVKPMDLDRYDVFVQSTSYSRRLVAGTRFLYEVNLDR